MHQSSLLQNAAYIPKRRKRSTAKGLAEKPHGLCFAEACLERKSLVAIPCRGPKN